MEINVMPCKITVTATITIITIKKESNKWPYSNILSQFLREKNQFPCSAKGIEVKWRFCKCK